MHDLIHKYVKHLPYLSVFIAQFLCFNASLSHINLITQLYTWIYIYISLSIFASFCLSVCCFHSPHLEFKYEYEFESILYRLPRKNTKSFHCVHIVMLLVVYTIAYPPPQLPYPSPWPSNALANPTFVCQCVWKFSGLRAAWRVALSELLLPDYLLLNRRAENVKSGERRVENSV